MRSKIYSIALMVCVGIMAHTLTNAQNVPAVQPVPPVAPVQATPPVAAIAPDATVYVSNNYVSAVPYTTYGYGSQDTTYRAKMRKLQEQMRALNKEMSDLAREESKKSTAAMQEKMAIARKAMSSRFDSTMRKNFTRTFNSNLHFNFDSDSNLEKQVASGDVKQKVKTISKSYPLSASDKLQIDNRYGKITVNTWAKNEVKVDVDIKAYANEDSDAQKLIDQTNVDAGKSGDVVAFTTNIDRGENSWWGTSSENGRITKVRKVVINYTVYMPIKSALTITNKYGAIILPDLDGKLTINNSYGSLVAKSLTNSDNAITVKYGSANITSLSNSDVDVSYGSLQLESADNLNAQLSYSPAKIGRLSTSGTFNIRYGSGLEIGDVGKNLKTLSINSSYAPVKLSSLNDMNADFDVTVHYGDFLYNNATYVTSKTPDNERGFTSTKNFKGHVGKGSSDKVITVKSTYSNVKFD